MTKRQMILLSGQMVVLTILLLIIMGIGSQFIPATPESGEQPVPFLGLVLCLQFLQTIALSYVVIRARWSGLRLMVGIFVLYFCTTTALSQIESIIYLEGQMAPGMQTGIILMGLFAAAVFSPILVITLSRWRHVFPDNAGAHLPLMSDRSLKWKVPLGGAIYLAFYYLFGYYIAWKSPELRDYYGGVDPGSFLAQMKSIVADTPWMIPFQFLRGLCWALLALLGVRMMRGAWWEAGLALSLVFTVPSLFLLMPNPIMPEAIRMVHLVETVPYQLLYGWLAAFLFGRCRSVV
jgi:hypothetical protein